MAGAQGEKGPVVGNGVGELIEIHRMAVKQGGTRPDFNGNTNRESIICKDNTITMNSASAYTRKSVERQPCSEEFKKQKGCD